jgi:hypothetical protein
MSRQLWGCYAVADHLQRRAFVSDVLLYERLVIPVRPSDEPGREAYTVWRTSGWEPERQERLLNILGEIAHRVPWNTRRRGEFATEWSTAAGAEDVADATARSRDLAGHPVSEAAAALTRRQITRDLTEKVLATGNIRAIAVYADPARFDAEWRVRKAWPLVYRARTIRAGRPRMEVEDALPGQQADISHVLIGKFAIPEKRDATDEDMLKRAVEFAGLPKVTRWRADFHEWLSEISSRQLSDETIVREMGELVDAYNSMIKRRSRANGIRRSAWVLGTGVGAGAALTTGVPHSAKLATGPTVAAGRILADRVYGGEPGPAVGVAALMAESAKALRR